MTPRLADPQPLEALFAQRHRDPIVGAFSGTPPAHPFPDVTPVSETESAGSWLRLAATPRAGPSVGYVHVPYCANHCLFCGFYRHAWEPSSGADYVDAVLTHVARDGREAYAMGEPLQALYVGGGTPTALATADLTRLLAGLRRHLDLAPDCEVTIEGRIHDFGLAKARAARDAGATRFSLGVQTVDERLRKRLGRNAGTAEVIGFLDRLERNPIILDRRRRR